MDTVPFFEVSVCVWCMGVRWEGQGYWEVPIIDVDWLGLATAITRCVTTAVLNVAEGNEHRLRIDGQVVHFHSEQADKMLQRENVYAMDDPARLHWQCRTHKPRAKKGGAEHGNRG